MRKLKLQVQMTIDGFVCGPNGELDWMTGAMDEQVLALINELTDSSDTILMGRKMTEGFVNYWENIVDNHPESPEYEFAKKMVDIPKVVFSKTQSTMPGRNVRVENGDLATAVKALKAQPGKDLIVYGGAGFVSSLIEQELIDELYLFINPTTLGEGKRIFKTRKNYQPVSSIVYGNGEVVTKYILAK